jgi:hypothetical protein
VPHAAETRGTSSADATAGANHWPEVDVVAEALRSKERALGKLELAASPAGDDWRIDKLALANEHGRIDAKGAWRNVASRSRTALDVTVDVKEAGEFLSRFGWPNAVRGRSDEDRRPSRVGGCAERFRLSVAVRRVQAALGRRPVHEARSRRRAAPRGAVAAGCCRAASRSISRDVFSEGFAFDYDHGRRENATA